MKKNIYKFKVTPEVDGQLKTVAQHLPAVQLLNAKGEPIFHERSKHVPWSELSDKDKIKFPQEEFWPRRRGENFDRPKLYIVRWTVPVLENHYIKMYWIFREYGDAGVAYYVDQINIMTEASKKAAAEIRAKNEVPVPETAEPDGKV